MAAGDDQPGAWAKHLETTIQYLNMVDDNLIEASNEFYEKHSAIYGIQELLQ